MADPSRTASVGDGRAGLKRVGLPASAHQRPAQRPGGFGLSFRDVEDLLAERGVTVSCETIRQWRQTFGPDDGVRMTFVRLPTTNGYDRRAGRENTS